MSGNALAFLANDRYFKWVMTFLESVRSKDSKLPLYCIPHSGPIAGVLDLQRAFGFEILEDGLDRLDAFAKRLFPHHVRHRANLRKYSALTLQVNEVAYFDADTVMLVEPSRLFGHIRPGVDFIYLSTSPEWVYASRKVDMARSLFPDMRLMSAGAFVTNRNRLTIDDIITTIEKNMDLYQALRRGRVFDQPVLNFALHKLGKHCRHISELDATLTGMASSRDPNLRSVDGRIVYGDAPGDLVALHWAGDAKSWFQLFNPLARGAIQRTLENIHGQATQRVSQAAPSAS